MPSPGTTRTSLASGSDSPRAAACASSASASGWRTPCSSAAARASASSALQPSRHQTTRTCSAWPQVSVPVLSNTQACTDATASSACPRAISTPARDSRAVAAASAAGTASDSAHGQLTTSTAIIAGAIRAGSIHHHSSAVAAAIASSTSVNQCAATSASRAARGLCSKAPFISSTICAMRVPWPARSARTTSGESTFMLPASTASPGSLATASASPVSSASSAWLLPSSTVPSTGTRLALGTCTTSPARSRVIATLCHRPSGSRRRTAAGSCSISSSAAWVLRWRRLASISRADSSSARNIVTESKYTGPLPRTTLTQLTAKAPHKPSTTGTSMPRRRMRRSRQQPCRKVQPENSNAGKVIDMLAQRKMPVSAAFIDPAEK
ncbi:hypothetical protein GALL_320330 [mine drainage metagenome]|uniref:Uncharacterized protein n=1 Tax=mine drainage metagenome TaxID=410659 RepID=A0A1J5QRZ9_9ZZZZ